MPERVQITGPAGERYVEILSPKALELLVLLHDALADRRAELLAARRSRQAQLSAGALLDFLPETAHIREDASWRVAPPAAGLVDRRVEITGPTDRKMTINALNSGAKVWLADFEDANTPLWENMIEGQLNLKDALDRTIDFTSAEGKSYALNPADTLATIVVRPRGWHLDEKHILIDGRRASGSLTDFALYMAASAQRQLDTGKGPYFYLAKMESHLEARMWNDAFNIAQDYLAHPARHDQGHGADRDDPGRLRDGRDPVRAARAQRRAERGALGLPVLRDQEVPHPGPRLHAARAERGDDDRPGHARLHRPAGADLPQARRVRHGRHGGVHPVPARPGGQRDRAGEGPRGQDPRGRRRIRRLLGRAPGPGAGLRARSFDEVLGARPNQLARQRPDVAVTADDLLAFAKTPGGVTEAGLRNNISVALQYLATWLGGTGAVAIFNLMEDAATAEISRSQIWQWIHNDVILDDGPLVTKDVVERMIDEELVKIRELAGDDFDPARYGQAVALFTEVALADSFAEFLTLPAYERMP